MLDTPSPVCPHPADADADADVSCRPPAAIAILLLLLFPFLFRPSTLSLPNDKKQSRRDIDQACAAAREQPPPCYAVPCIDGSPWQRIKGSGEGARFASPPEARNHRFFVGGLGEFREVVCTPPPVDG